MDWASLFDEATPAPGATLTELEQFVATIGLPLSATEMAEVNRSQQNPFPPGDPLHAAYRPFDSNKWMIPARPLPAAYLDFLRWSNGGWCRSGEREFGFFPAMDAGNGVRAMMLAYHLPQYMPGALLFAFNGGGTFYLFDMRQDGAAGEYPIVCAAAGNLGWDVDASLRLADNLEAACRGKINVDTLLTGGRHVEEPAPPERIDIYLIRAPKGGVKQLRAACNHIGVPLPLVQLSAILKKIPYRICDNVRYIDCARLITEANRGDPCLGMFVVDPLDQPVSLPPWEWH